MNIFIKGRRPSINYLYKEPRYADSTLEKKSVCLAVRIVGGGGAYSSRGIPQKYFSTFTFWFRFKVCSFLIILKIEHKIDIR